MEREAPNVKWLCDILSNHDHPLVSPVKCTGVYLFRKDPHKYTWKSKHNQYLYLRLGGWLSCRKPDGPDLPSSLIRHYRKTRWIVCRRLDVRDSLSIAGLDAATNDQILVYNERQSTGINPVDSISVKNDIDRHRSCGGISPLTVVNAYDPLCLKQFGEFSRISTLA